MKNSIKFNRINFAAIKQKVGTTEKNISGEIVPVIVNQCGDYNSAAYKGALIGAAGIFVSLVIADRFLPGIAIYDPLWYFIYVAIGGMLSASAVYLIPSLKRLLTGKDKLDNAAAHSADSFFCKEEVFNTKERTGIMIFIALFERRVIIKADTGISKVVNQSIWDDLVGDLLNSIKRNKISDGLITAIETCGNILKDNGFHSTPDDKNELSNELRIEG